MLYLAKKYFHHSVWYYTYFFYQFFVKIQLVSCSDNRWVGTGIVFLIQNILGNSLSFDSSLVGPVCQKEFHPIFNYCPGMILSDSQGGY